MAMHTRFIQTLRLTIAATATLILVGSLTSGASAQAIRCAPAPALAAIDSNGDGILTVDEIRSADPNNADLQAQASRLEAAGISGIQYTGCDPAAGGTTTGGGAGNGTTTGDTSGNGTTTGDGTGNNAAPGTGAANGSTTGDGTGTTTTTGNGAGNGTTTATGTATVATRLPNTGEGSQGSSENMAAVGMMAAAASGLALAGAATWLTERGS